MNELNSGAALFGLAVDPARDGQIVWITYLVGGENARSEWTEAIHGLAQQPLSPVLAQLPVSGTDVEGHGVAKDEIFGGERLDVLALLPDDDSQFSLPVQFLQQIGWSNLPNTTAWSSYSRKPTFVTGGYGMSSKGPTMALENLLKNIGSTGTGLPVS